MDTAGASFQAGDRASQHVGQAHFSTFDLMFAGPAAELLCDL